MNGNKDKNENEVLPGMMAWKTHPYDGTERAGKPIGSPLRVEAIKNGHVYPNGSPGADGFNCVAILSDGSEHYCWNIICPQ